MPFQVSFEKDSSYNAPTRCTCPAFYRLTEGMQTCHRRIKSSPAGTTHG